ncbi:MAG: hypothetical protein JO037_26785 [Actinobacteria bacterium]|nr:hypothetical protein [Actinomycetota bacterium]
MKRIRMSILLSLLAVVLPIGLFQGVAQAGEGGGGGGSQNQVIIQPQAQYILAGSVIDVGLYVKCQGGSGEVIVNVNQSPPQTPYPVATGSGPQTVVCDGQFHSVAVTVTGVGFDAGEAWATAQLENGSATVLAQAQRWIDIVVVG